MEHEPVELRLKNHLLTSLQHQIRDTKREVAVGGKRPQAIEKFFEDSLFSFFNESEIQQFSLKFMKFFAEDLYLESPSDVA